MQTARPRVSAKKADPKFKDQGFRTATPASTANATVAPHVARDAERYVHRRLKAEPEVRAVVLEMLGLPVG